MRQQGAAKDRKERFLDSASLTAQLHRRALEFLPGGTSRHHYSFDPWPIVASHGVGCRLTDIDGDERIDCLNNMTALIHGHADPDLVEALAAQAKRGVSFSEPVEAEVELAQLIVERVPSVAQVHFRASGTEAVMIAVKLARAFTGRTAVAKFEGSYHGYYDYVQMSTTPTEANWGEANSPSSVPSSSGLSAHVPMEVVVLPFNDFEGVERLLATKRSSIAALLVEPLSNRSGMVMPKPGFYRFLREVTKHYGILLIFDEVISFRLGLSGAQGLYGGEPDLTTFGKIIGGGLPIGAVGGKSDVMAVLSPASGGTVVSSGGTHSGSALAMVAGLAAMRKVTSAEFSRLDALGRRLRSGANIIMRSRKQLGQVCGDGSLFQVVPTSEELANYRSIPRDQRANDWLERLHRELLASGMIISQRGLGCLSTAMNEADVDQCLEAFDIALGALEQEH